MLEPICFVSLKKHTANIVIISETTKKMEEKMIKVDENQSFSSMGCGSAKAKKARLCVRLAPHL